MSRNKISFRLEHGRYIVVYMQDQFECPMGYMNEEGEFIPQLMVYEGNRIKTAVERLYQENIVALNAELQELIKNLNRSCKE